jgi:hypothetical protein
MGTDWTTLRASAEAAREQLRTGPKEWPGRPSAQRLAFFLAATPDVVLQLLNELEEARR